VVSINVGMESVLQGSISTEWAVVGSAGPPSWWAWVGVWHQIISHLTLGFLAWSLGQQQMAQLGNGVTLGSVRPMGQSVNGWVNGVRHNGNGTIRLGIPAMWLWHQNNVAGAQWAIVRINNKSMGQSECK